MHPVLAFLLHRYRSKSRHGIHSPFVYELIDRCIYAEKPKPAPGLLKHFRSLRHDQSLLSGFDFGQGKETNRTVSDYARTSTISDLQAALLFRLINYLQPKNALELGSNLGKTSALLASVDPNMKYFAVEGNQALFEHAQSSFNALELPNIKLINDDFDGFFTKNQDQFDFVFLDGDHSYGPTLRYYKEIKKIMHSEGVLIFHDIYHSDEMKAAWEKIKKDQAVSVSLDLFFFGLVWFSRDQAHQHFSIQFPKLLVQLAL